MESATEATTQWSEPGKLIALTFDDGTSTETMVHVPDVLKTILPELKAQGYRFVTLTQVYEEAGYEVPGPTPGVKFPDNKSLNQTNRAAA